MTNCHKNITSPCCPEIHTFLHVQLGSWSYHAAILLCERYIIKCYFPLQAHRTLTAYALSDACQYQKCAYGLWKLHGLGLGPPSRATRTYTAHNRLLAQSNSTAKKYLVREVHRSTQRIHFPYLHHTYKFLMQEKCARKYLQILPRINGIDFHTHTYYVQCLLWAT